MEELDPGGPGPPAVGHYVTISNDSSMDTDASCSISRKRPAVPRRRCKKCQKKIKRDPKKAKPDINCMCLSDNESNFHNKQDNIIPETQTIDDKDKNQGLMDSRVSRLLYKESDSSPYIVHIQKVIKEPNENVNFHPIVFGNYLKRNNIQNIVNGSIKKIARNRLSVAFTVHSEANNFIRNPLFNSEQFKSFIPSFQVSRIGLVRGIPTDWSDNDIISNITVPIGCGEILKIRRMKKKTIVNGTAEFITTGSVVITFDGQTLPKRVYMCYNALTVDLYIYPTIQCYNCCRYGHVKNQCRSTPRCFRCGQGHAGDSCAVEEESIFCCLCQGSHIATDKKCPEYQRQKSIKESMAHNCLSYSEASKLHPTVSKLYSDVLMSNVSTSPVNIQKSNFLNNNGKNNANLVQRSYKKTVFKQPKSPARQEIGYDRQAHAKLTKDYDPPTGNNGSAYPVPNLDSSSLQETILALNKLIATLSTLSPSNVASYINESHINTSSNNGQHNPMELPKCS